MRNHNEKIRDISRSVLPSRRNVRTDRRLIHKTERARVRTLLRQPDVEESVDLDLTKHPLRYLVRERREAVNVAALVNWGTSVVARTPHLDGADLPALQVHFTSLLPDGLIGWHAWTHLEWALRHRRPRPMRTARGLSDLQRVQRIVDEAMISELNRAIQTECRQVYSRKESRVVDGKRVVTTVRFRLARRFLLGAHDVDAFAADLARFSASRDALQQIWQQLDPR